MANVDDLEEKPTIQCADFWQDARRRSLEPGGFGKDRIDLWPKLLHVKHQSHLHSKEESSPHKDERQIRLDTDRSFVMYPVDKSKDRDSMQEELYRLLVDVFRKRPKLSYFQGYHDIITVLFLTLPPEMQLICAEKVSLHRVRDSMGTSLEPVLGLLRFMKKLLRLVDPEYADLLEQSTPLPYFALSNLLTLFSHDMPTLPLIQHVFDYLLSRPPIMVVYLATALTISRKPEVQRLQAEGEDGMLHSLLTGLPELTDETAPTESENESAVKLSDDENSKATIDPTEVKSEDLSPAIFDEYIPLDEENTKVEPDESKTLIGGTTLEMKEAPSHLDERSEDDMVQTEEDIKPPGSSPEIEPETEETVQSPGQDTHSVTADESSSYLNATPELKPSPPSSPSPSPSSSSEPTLPPPEFEDRRSQHKSKPTIALSTLLQLSDSLYESYPVSHPALSLSSIMGPQSVVFTWSTSSSDLPSDDTAERMVEHPELIVYPYVEDLGDKEKDGEDSRRSRRKRQKAKRRLQRVLEFRDKKTMVAGAVLVLGVAMAIYGVKAGVITGDGRTAGHHYHLSKEQLQRIGGWVGGVFAAAGERVFNVGF